MAGTLVVGASQAGLQLAASLREFLPDEPITLVGAEQHPPYQRPPLSKAFLAGEEDQAAVELRSPDFYARANIGLIRSERVSQVAVAPSGSGTATTEHGRSFTFDRLALTVGAQPRRLRIPGSDLDGVCYLRTVDDSADLRRRLATGTDIVIVGGGFIGLEVAALARSRDKTVTVVEAAGRLIPRSVAPIVSDFYYGAHTRRGTSIRLGVEVAAIVGAKGRVREVQLGDGSSLPADVVLVGIGAVPRTELAEQIGLACRGGIIVDEFARTSMPSVVAAGDCTVGPNPLTGEGSFRLESMQNAVNQARTAAATLAGRTEPYTAVPWFWSDQGDVKLKIAGLTAGYNEYVVRGDPATERFSVLYYRDDRLLGVHAVNQASDFLVVRQALSRRANIPADAVVRTNGSLKGLVVEGVAS